MKRATEPSGAVKVWKMKMERVTKLTTMQAAISKN